MRKKTERKENENVRKEKEKSEAIKIFASEKEIKAMTCKDCIHYEVCYYHDFEDCEWFKCKSEFVHIPCNIGSTVYFADVEFNADTKNFEPKIYKTVVDSYTANKFYTLYHTRRGNDFTDSMLGKIVFITREEAEEALAERNKK